MPKRRRGVQARTNRNRSVSHRRTLPGRGHSVFEALVERALSRIPPPFSRALDEVAVVVEDEPTRDQLRENGIRPDETLYGLYEGTPRTEWGADWSPFPNKISLFRLPLEEDFPDPDELADEVRITVIHELAHHLGIDDERLDELGIE
jgi:predicted Zn-dependent protease with MMP-like domain